MRALLEQTARHSTQLGLHKEAAASLYAPHEQVGLLFSAFYYSDMWVVRCSLLNKTMADETRADSEHPSPT